MSVGGENRPAPHQPLVGWSAPGKGSRHGKDSCVYNLAVFENFTTYQLGRSQVQTKSVCNSNSGRLQAEVSFLLKVCIL